jgi:hypothetical protein
MPSVIRPVYRSQRRSRRRQLALICVVFGYLAAFVAGVLALLSLGLATGSAAVTALLVAGSLIVLALALWAADSGWRFPRGPGTRAPLA